MIIVKLTKKEIRALRSFIEYFVENIPIKKTTVGIRGGRISARELESLDDKLN